MNYTYELNNLRKDSDVFNGKFNKNSPIVEIFSAMVKGEELNRFGVRADKAVDYIKALGERAENGDFTAVSELNTLRRFVIEAPVMEEMKLLGIFGNYQNIGYDETIEREVFTHAGEHSREQAESGDVVFPTMYQETYTVPTFTVSGGYAVDYRRVALGDMSKENEGLNQVKIDIRNRAIAAIVNRIYKALQAATGIKFMLEEDGLTKTGVDDVIAKVRRMGRPTVIGEYALLTQFTPWAGYAVTVNGNTITGISEKAMNEIAQNGILGTYNGAILSEMPNPYDYYNIVDDGNGGKTFGTLLPAGLGFVVPTGAQSPIATWTRGGLTSFTGNNVKNGKIETRLDLTMACDIAKGQESKIGVIYDSSIGGLAQ